MGIKIKERKMLIDKIIGAWWKVMGRMVDYGK